MALGASIVEYALQLARAGTSAALAIAIGTTPDAAARIGFHGDTSLGAEKLGVVVGGIAGASVEVSGTDLRLRLQTGTRDGIALVGRAGGTTSLLATLTTAALTASRTATLPDADITLAGINLAQTWTAAQNFGTGTTVIATADINGGAIDGTAIGAASPSTVVATTLTATGLTSGRVAVTSTGGLLTAPSTLTYNGRILAHTSASTGADALTVTNTSTGAAQAYFGAVNDNAYGIYNSAQGTGQTGTTLGIARAGYCEILTVGTGNGLKIGNNTTGQPIIFGANTEIARMTNTAVTLASGINLAMSGASTATFGTGAFTVPGAATFNAATSAALTVSTSFAGDHGVAIRNTSSGTTSSGYVSVRNNSTATAIFQSYSSASTATLYGLSTANRIGFTAFGADNEGLLFGISVDKPIIFGVGTAERARLTSSALTLATGTALILPTATPASASATGVAGTYTWDADYLYVCTATDTWKRVAIATW